MRTTYFIVHKIRVRAVAIETGSGHRIRILFVQSVSLHASLLFRR